MCVFNHFTARVLKMGKDKKVKEAPVKAVEKAEKKKEEKKKPAPPPKEESSSSSVFGSARASHITVRIRG